MASTGERQQSATGAEIRVETLERVLRGMALLRAADERSQELARAGECGVHVPALGTEAVLAAVVESVESRDWLLPGVRQSAVALARGLSPVSWFAQVLGRVADPARGRQEPDHPSVRSLNVVSVSTPPGSQLVHAAGVGFSMRRAARGELAVALCGHGAAATPDFHVGLNFAAVWAVPVVFVVTSTGDLARQTASESIAVKADAYGLPGMKVDGGDAVALLGALGDAVERARRGEGPALIEAECAQPERPAPGGRLHLVGDDDAHRFSETDPLVRLERRLSEAGALDAAACSDLREEARRLVDEAVSAARRLPPPPASLLFEDVFARRTPALDRQLREWRGARREGPRD